MMRLLWSMLDTLPTVAMHCDETCTSRFDGSLSTHLSSCRRKSRADTPAARAILPPSPGYISTQQTSVPSGSEPSGWLSPSCGRTTQHNDDSKFIRAVNDYMFLSHDTTNSAAYRVCSRLVPCLSVRLSRSCTVLCIDRDGQNRHRKRLPTLTLNWLKRSMGQDELVYQVSSGSAQPFGTHTRPHSYR